MEQQGSFFARELRSMRERIRRRLQELNAATERGVMQSAQSVERVVKEAQSHLSRTSTLLHGLPSREAIVRLLHAHAAPVERLGPCLDNLSAALAAELAGGTHPVALNKALVDAQNAVQMLRTQLAGASSVSVDAVSALLEDTRSEVVREAGDFLEQVLQISAQSLSALQFQDPVAQELMAMDLWMYETERAFTANLDPAERLPVLPPLQLRAGDTAQPMEDPQSGKVSLF